MARSGLEHRLHWDLAPRNHAGCKTPPATGPHPAPWRLLFHLHPGSSLAILKSSKLGPRAEIGSPLFLMPGALGSFRWLGPNLPHLRLRSRTVPGPSRSLETSAFLMEPQSCAFGHTHVTC